MSKELLAGIVDEQQMIIYAEETAKLQTKYDNLKEKAWLFRFEVREALEALLGLEMEKATEILEKALKGDCNG